MGIEINDSFFATKLDSLINWSRKYSLFQYPFITSCCGIEYMSTACSHYDIARFGAEIPRFSPRQADLLFVVGTITHKMAPVLKRVYDWRFFIKITLSLFQGIDYSLFHCIPLQTLLVVA